VAPGRAGCARLTPMSPTSATPPVRAVLFDADGVLQMPREGWLDRLTTLGGPGFVEAAFAAEAECLDGSIDFGERLETLLAKREATVRDALAVWEDIVPDPDAFAVVERVRAGGLLCGLATNQQSRRGRYMRERTAIDRIFDRHYYSFEVGHAKPTRAYFEAIVEDLGIPAGQVAFVDDVPGNVEGARSVGLQAAWHDPASGAAGLAADLRGLGVPV